MLTGANIQIIEAFEKLGMSPEEIADSMEYDIVAVKATLLQFSTKYRDASRIEPNLDYTVDEQLEAKRTIVELMRNTSDDYLRARIALKVRDDGKGRLDVNKNMNGLNINVTMFNTHLIKAREALKKVLEPKKTIDLVPCE